MVKYSSQDKENYKMRKFIGVLRGAGKEIKDIATTSGKASPIRRHGFNKRLEREMYDQMGIRGDAGFSATPPKRTKGVKAWTRRLIYGPED